MEHRQPGPEGSETTTSSKASKAENIASWLQHKRDTEKRVIFDGLLDDNDTENSKDGSKKNRKLKLGSAFLQTDTSDKADQKTPDKSKDTHTAPEQTVDQTQTTEDAEAALHEVSEDTDAEHGDVHVVSEVSEPDDAAESAEFEADDSDQEHTLYVSEPAEYVPHTDAPHYAEANEQPIELPDAATSEWVELDTADVTSEVHDAEPNVSDQPIVYRQAAEQQQHQQYEAEEPLPPTPVAGGRSGGGGNVPPTGRNFDAAAYGQGPDSPNYNTLHTTYVPAAEAAGAVPYTTPNRLKGHEHAHGHPRLALAMAAGLLVEHIVGKRGDKRIDAEMRRRTDKLREQIERSQVHQTEAQTRLRAEQTRLGEVQHVQTQRQETFEHRATAQPTAASAERAGTNQTFNRTEIYAPVTTRQSEATPRRTTETARPRSVEFTAQAPVEAPPIELDAMPFAPDTDVYAEANVRPDVVAEQVAVAAEKDVAVERVYERRQEVRDEPGAGGVQGGGQSSGRTDDSSGSGYQPIDGLHTQASSYQSYTNNADARKLSATQYQAAIVRGAGVALAVIVLGLLAYALL